MRLVCVLAAALALAAPAAGATPRFALFDLKSDLAHASRNAFGDVAVRPRAALAGRGTLVECGTWCRLGAGWLAFARRPHLAGGDVSAARVRYSPRRGWTVRLTLRPGARGRWAAFVRGLGESAKLAGVPDVLVVVADGRVAATPLASEVSTARGVVTIAGFSRGSANALLAALS
jgi:hypothetical protein